MDWRKQARKALREYPAAKRRNGKEDLPVLIAVERALTMQGVYPNAAERRRMVEMVYFRRTHTMNGAALECHYSRETVQKWNVEILSAVYVGLVREQSAG